MAIEPDDLVATIQSALPGAIVELTDLTGTKDHWEATIVASQFEGKSRIQRHRMVFDALANEMAGPIHALSLNVYTPGQYAKGSS